MNAIVELIRLENVAGQGTFGVLKINKEVFCCTLEPENRLNERDESCIPALQYLCKRHHSPRFGETFQVLDVPGRSSILFHAGNSDENTHGCILLGQYFGKLKSDRAVLNSGATFKAFMLTMAGMDSFHLTIREAF